MSASKFVDPIWLTPHYNTSIYRGYISYLVKCLGEVRAKEVLSALPLPWEYISANNNWVSEEFSELFFDLLSAEKDLPSDFSYQAGLLTMSPLELGTLPLLFSKFVSTQVFCAETLKMSRKMNRVDDIHIEELQNGKLTLIVKSHRKTKHIIAINENWRGCLDGILLLQKVQAGSCIVSNNTELGAQFNVSWREKARFKPTLAALASVIVIFSCTLIYAQSSLPSIPVLLVSAYAVAASLLHINNLFNNKKDLKEIEILESVLNENKERYIDLFNSKTKLDRRFKEANLLRRVVARITELTTSADLVQQTVTEIRDTLKYDRVIFFGVNSFNNHLEVAGHSGFPENSQRALASYSIDLNEVTESVYHLGNVFKSKTSVLVPVTNEFMDSLTPSGRAMIERMGSQSYLACAVASEKRAFGVMLVDYAETKKLLDNDDLHIIENLSNQMAILLNNAQLLEEETKIRKSFQRFVPAEVISQMMKSDSSNATAINREVTVLFADIRGFTARSDSYPADVLVNSLNHYLSCMTDVIYRNGGIVDKFMGDGIMAVFNALGTDTNHAENAAQAAIRMQESMNEVNSFVAKIASGRAPWVPIEIGIGIHSGMGIVGNVGSNQKMEFTTLGKTVNIAARLQDLTKVHPGIIMSQSTKDLLGRKVDFVSIGLKNIRGIKDPMAVFSVSFNHQGEDSDARAS